MGRGCADRLARYVVVQSFKCRVSAARSESKTLICPQPGVKIILFLFPTVALCICFTIASIFPWYMSIVLSPLALIVMVEVRDPFLLTFPRSLFTHFNPRWRSVNYYNGTLSKKTLTALAARLVLAN
jgi:hypothetical protein